MEKIDALPRTYAIKTLRQLTSLKTALQIHSNFNSLNGLLEEMSGSRQKENHSLGAEISTQSP